MNYPNLNIYLASDHNGRYLQEVIASYLDKQKITWASFSKQQKDLGDDYPDFAQPVGQSVAHYSQSRGILICKTGVGMSIAANKVPGVRAGECRTPEEVKEAVAHNHLNVLCLGESFIEASEAVNMVKTFVESSYSQEPRHIRRVDKIKDLEQCQ